MKPPFVVRERRRVQSTRRDCFGNRIWVWTPWRAIARIPHDCIEDAIALAQSKEGTIGRCRVRHVVLRGELLLDNQEGSP